MIIGESVATIDRRGNEWHFVTDREDEINRLIEWFNCNARAHDDQPPIMARGTLDELVQVVESILSVVRYRLLRSCKLR